MSHAEKAVKQTHVLSVRLVLALIKGMCWGWVVSFAVTLWLWSQDGFMAAGQRLAGQLQSEYRIEQTYRDNVVLQGILQVNRFFQDKAARLMQSVPAGVVTGQVDRLSVSLAKDNWLGPLWHRVKFILTSLKILGLRGWWLIESNTWMVLNKALLMLMALPVLLLAWCLGLMDGLVLREVRTAEFGRESSFLFHRVVQCLPTLLWLLIADYMVSPAWISPVVYFMGMGVITLVLTSRVAATFKKYV